jgi:hypothetical protein
MPSLRYVWFDSSDRDRIVLVLARPEFQLSKTGMYVLRHLVPNYCFFFLPWSSGYI